MNTKSFLVAVMGLGFSLTPGISQVANDSPTGTSGDFNGAITTGCHYDPYTGSARRTVTDITVAGAVGAYPLQFTRAANSRYTAGIPSYFGDGGPWLHSYQWQADGVVTQSATPSSITVNYPDGRRTIFSSQWSGRGGATTDPYLHGPPGTRDRVQFIKDTSTTGRCYLLMPDGGKVFFSASIVPPTPRNNYYNFQFQLQSIIDPYGQTTTISGAPYPSGVVTITEPAGRWIKIHHNPQNLLITSVEASDGRQVYYDYNASGFLSQVRYWDSGIAAQYSYSKSVAVTNPNFDGTFTPLQCCSDPMYPGPMWRVAYTYATGNNADGTATIPGQIKAENYWDGTFNGAGAPNVLPVSTLDVVAAPSPAPSPSPASARKETRGDGKTRTISYAGSLLKKWTDFKGVTASHAQDSNGYLVAATDRKGNTTNFAVNSFTGAVSQVQYPATPFDAPAGRGTVNYSYVATCSGAADSDPNNCDPNNPYWLHSMTDESGHTAVYLRDSNHRVSQIKYPDGGTESFTYNSFGQVLTHRLRTGGLETFTYDTRGLLTEYRDPYHLSSTDSQNPSVPASSTPTYRYAYDALDRVRSITDALGSALDDPDHTVNLSYNTRGQVTTTTFPTNPDDGVRHTIVNGYYLATGALATVTDQLNHVTSFAYDDYRRVSRMTTSGHNSPLSWVLFYDTTGTGPYYNLTDANVTFATSPSGKTVAVAYDENRRRISVTTGTGQETATTSYAYDANGNLVSVLSPNEQTGGPSAGKSTTAVYDERNRIQSASDAYNNAISFRYDSGGRKASITRANGQLVTFDTYDAMNRLLQQTVKQAPDPDAVTKYTYNAAGLLQTIQDPHLVQTASADAYSYSYDLLGRKLSSTYPADSGGNHKTELWHYDTAGRVDQFTNRAGAVQTNVWDALNRLQQFSWSDGTPTVSWFYDAVNRPVRIVSPNATIGRSYFNDGLLNAETSTYADNIARTVSYTYDDDGNRASIQYPGGSYLLNYHYTSRNQLSDLIDNATNGTIAHFVYDADGNMTTRSLDNSTSTAVVYDAMDRITHIAHSLNGTTRTLDYAYDSVSNRKWVKRDGSTGDVFGYDQNDQATSILLNVGSPDTTSPGSQTISYDANGNRTTFSAYGPTDSYTTNNLNQYTVRNGTSASYSANGNLTAGFDGSTYTYDAQNRLTNVSAPGHTGAFGYDGLNRRISETIDGSSTKYNVYDGWNLIAVFISGSTAPRATYISTGRMILKTAATYFYQDASGSTSHLADSTGHLTQWQRYDLHGTPTFYDSTDTQLASPSINVRQLFTGQLWYSEFKLYDLRNRFYSPDIGRFLQPDPIRFYGDPTNLYRHCGNNPRNRHDFWGLQSPLVSAEAGHQPDGQAGADMWEWENPDSYDLDVEELPSSEGLDLSTEVDYGSSNEGSSPGGDISGDIGSVGGGEFAGSAGGFSGGGLGGGEFASGGSLSGAEVGGTLRPEGGGAASGSPALRDPQLIQYLDEAAPRAALAGIIRAIGDKPGEIVYWDLMAKLDTPLYNGGEMYYLNYSGELAPNMVGTWVNVQVNYIGVGEGFAAGGFSVNDMNDVILLWNQQYSTPNLTYGKMQWAKVGYDYFNARTRK